MIWQINSLTFVLCVISTHSRPLGHFAVRHYINTFKAKCNLWDQDFTESAPRQIQSSLRNVRGYNVCPLPFKRLLPSANLRPTTTTILPTWPPGSPKGRPLQECSSVVVCCGRGHSLCPSLRRSVGPSLRRSVAPSLRRSVAPSLQGGLMID